MIKYYEELNGIAKAIGSRSDYFQGAGGNISIKIDDHAMLIKASGRRLVDLVGEQGYVLVNYQSLVELNQAGMSEQEYNQLLKASVLEVTDLRPSIEAGLHASLSRCVIHSHSVYANIVNCSTEIAAVIRKIFPDAEVVEYYSPGAALSSAVGLVAQPGEAQVIFLKNHGLIVTADSAEAALAAHEKINQELKSALSISKAYCRTELLQSKESVFQSVSESVQQALVEHPMLYRRFKDEVLFPDQAVFCDSLDVDEAGQDARISIDTKNKKVVYNMSMKEAKAADENLCAWLYIVINQQRLGLTTNRIKQDKVAYINNMESEKYRKTLCK